MIACRKPWYRVCIAAGIALSLQMGENLGVDLYIVGQWFRIPLPRKKSLDPSMGSYILDAWFCGEVCREQDIKEWGLFSWEQPNGPEVKPSGTKQIDAHRLCA